jgi:hypothetical protein
MIRQNSSNMRRQINQLKYTSANFGFFGELDEKSDEKRQKYFDSFIIDSQKIEWRDIEERIRNEMPKIGETLFNIGYNSLSNTFVESKHNPFFNTSKMVAGHELEGDFESEGRKKIVDIVSSALPDVFLVAESQHILEDNEKYSDISKFSKNIENSISNLVDTPNVVLSYDIIDGNVNFLNNIINLSKLNSGFSKSLYDDFIVDAGTCLSFSLPQYPNYPFVTSYYSFKTKRVISFLRDKYGERGISLIGYANKDTRSAVIKPVEFMAGAPKIIVPNYVGNNYDLNGCFKESLREYFKFFDIEVHPDGGSRSSSIDLESLIDNQAFMYADVRSIIPSLNPDKVATLQLSDITALGSVLSSSGWVTLHSDGTLIDEVRTQKTTTKHIPIDFTAINSNMIPLNMEFPNPLDSLQYARIKMMQKLYSKHNIGLINTKKIKGYRFFSPSTSEFDSKIYTFDNEEQKRIDDYLNDINLSIESFSGDDLSKIDFLENLAKKAKKTNNILIYNALVSAYALSDNNSFDNNKYNAIDNYVIECEELFQEKIEEIKKFICDDETKYAELLKARQELALVYSNLSRIYSFEAEKLYEEGEFNSNKMKLHRFRSIGASQKAVDFDPLNFHYIKQHAMNLRLSKKRLHSTKVLMENALELGFKSGGYYSKDYLGKLIDCMEKIDESGSSKMVFGPTIDDYKKMLNNSTEDYVDNLVEIISSKDKIRFSGLWRHMRDNYLTKSQDIEDAISLVKSNEAGSIEEIIECLSIKIPDMKVIKRANEGKSRRLYKAVLRDSTGSENDYRAIVVYKDLSAPCSQSQLNCQRKNNSVANASSLVINERGSSQALKHDNIVHFYHNGLTQEGGKGRHYMAYEYINGDNLEVLVHRGLKENKFIDYIVQISDALSFIHSHGYLHRDVKLDNIMVNKNKAILTDLQFLCEMNEGESIRDDLASHRYAAPELLLDGKYENKTNATIQSEIYALGASLYYGISSDYTSEKNLLNLNTKIYLDGNDEVGFNSFIEKDIDDKIKNTKLKEVIKKALKYNPKERYNSMDEFKTDLLKVYSK